MILFIAMSMGYGMEGHPLLFPVAEDQYYTMALHQSTQQQSYIFVPVVVAPFPVIREPNVVIAANLNGVSNPGETSGGTVDLFNTEELRKADEKYRASCKKNKQQWRLQNAEIINSRKENGDAVNKKETKCGMPRGSRSTEALLR